MKTLQRVTFFLGLLGVCASAPATQEGISPFLSFEPPEVLDEYFPWQAVLDGNQVALRGTSFIFGDALGIYEVSPGGLLEPQMNPVLTATSGGEMELEGGRFFYSEPLRGRAWYFENTGAGWLLEAGISLRRNIYGDLANGSLLLGQRQQGMRSFRAGVFQRSERGWDLEDILRVPFRDARSRARYGPFDGERALMLAPASQSKGQAVHVFDRQGNGWVKGGEIARDNAWVLLSWALAGDLLAVSGYTLGPDPLFGPDVFWETEVFEWNGVSWQSAWSQSSRERSSTVFGIHGEGLLVSEQQVGELEVKHLVYERAAAGWEPRYRLMPSEGNVLRNPRLENGVVGAVDTPETFGVGDPRFVFYRLP